MMETAYWLDRSILMKCKKGDMAVIVGGKTGTNLGEEVTWICR